MARYVAFLRAINVGGRYVKMERLREVLGALNFASLSTFIASGNVIFETRARAAARLEADIEDCLRQGLGYEVATFVRTPAELAAVAGFRPFERPEDSGAILYVAFLRAAPDEKRRQAVMALRGPADDLRLEGRELYWMASKLPGAESALNGARLERALAGPATVRNVATVRRLAEQLAG